MVQPTATSGAVPTLTERLFGVNGPERLERYTRLSAYSLFALVPLVGVSTVAYLGNSERPEALWLGVAWGAGLLVCCALGLLAFRRALEHYLEGPPLRSVDWVPLVAVTAVTAALPVTFPPSAGESFGSPGMATLVALLPAACGLSPAFPPRWVWRVVLGAVAATAAVQAASGVDATHLGVTAAIALLWTGLFVPTMRMSAWMIGVVRELDRARATSARLAVAEERLRFSRDLHDVVGRSLSTISLKTELASALLQRQRTEQATAELTAVRDLAADALTEMRAVVAGYRRADLTAELAGARAVLHSAGVRTRLLGPLGQVEQLDEGVQEALAWAVREATTNVVRHSSATRCTLAFEVGQRDVLLTITNDGVGAAAPAADDVTHHHGGGGNGLLGLGERLAALGGTLRHGAQADTYVLRARVPLPAAAALLTAPATTSEDP